MNLYIGTTHTWLASGAIIITTEAATGINYHR